MSDKACAPWSYSNGFTLIEVIAALVIFSGGVLMVLQMSGSLSRQMEWAAAASEIVVVAQARLDSLDAEAFADLTPGTTSETVTVAGKSYTLGTTISSVTALLVQLDVSMIPASGVNGPSYATTSYSADTW